jgi:hypothetical protein
MRRPAILAAVVAALIWPSPSAAQVPCGPWPSAVQRQLLIGTRSVGYFSSHDINVSNSQVRRAVILIHGQSGNAADYYRTLHESKCVSEFDLGYVPGATEENILIAPHFPDDSPEDDAVPPANFHVWAAHTWAEGKHSLGSSPTVSSYSVMDTFVSRLTATLRGGSRRFPNLEMIVVAGFSAGGQYVHRYAATNGRDGNLPPGVQMRYVVAGPSSYLYLDNRRPYSDGQDGFGVPYFCTGLLQCTPNWGFWSAPVCPIVYNFWRYGLDGLNSYAGAVGVAAIRERLVSRNVIVLIGTEDVGDNRLDTTCSGRLQGEQRYDRARKFVDYMDARYPANRHWLIEVPGAGHDRSEMFTAEVHAGAVGSLILFADF